MAFSSFKGVDRALPQYEDKFQAKKKATSRSSLASFVQSFRSKLGQRIFLGIIALLCVYKFLLSGGTLYDHDHDFNVFFYDLKDTQGTGRGWENEERILVCIPLRNAEPVIDLMISHLQNLTYPHHLIDLAFLVSDSDDNTVDKVLEGSFNLQTHTEISPFNEITIYERDFGQVISQDFSDRHGVAVQGVRRKVMGKARNWIWTSALKPEHTWVYWRDADIETAPATILEDLMKHNIDVIVPNVWRPLPEWLGSEQPYDLNSWIESPPALELAQTLHEDDVIVEGYAEYPTWRPHLAYLRQADGNPNDLVELDGIGGVSILAKAKVFRNGAHFAGFTFENHAETEAFGKMCKKMGFTVGGLPHYTIWHLYEPSEDDLKEMAEREKKGLSNDLR